MGKNTTMTIKKTTRKQLLRAKGLHNYLNATDLNYDEFILSLSEESLKNNEAKIGKQRGLHE